MGSIKSEPLPFKMKFCLLLLALLSLYGSGDCCAGLGALGAAASIGSFGLSAINSLFDYPVEVYRSSCGKGLYQFKMKFCLLLLALLSLYGSGDCCAGLGALGAAASIGSFGLSAI